MMPHSHPRTQRYDMRSAPNHAAQAARLRYLLFAVAFVVAFLFIALFLMVFAKMTHFFRPW